MAFSEALQTKLLKRGRRHWALGLPSISEDGGGSSPVTATLSGTTSEDVTLTVSATAVLPASASDFALSTNKGVDDHGGSDVEHQGGGR